MSSAAAQVRGQNLSELVTGEGGILVEGSLGQHQKAGGAEPALKPVMLPKRLLEGMEDTVGGESLHRFDGRALALDGEEKTGAHRGPVDQDGAGPTNPVLTSEMCPGEPAVFADSVSKSLPRLNLDRLLPAVHQQGDVPGRDHAAPSIVLRIRSLILEGVAGISEIPTPRGRRASQTALITAAGAPIAPPSPNPLAPVIEASVMVCR